MLDRKAQGDASGLDVVTGRDRRSVGLLSDPDLTGDFVRITIQDTGSGIALSNSVVSGNGNAVGENGLIVREEIAVATARLIANPVSHKLKAAARR